MSGTCGSRSPRRAAKNSAAPKLMADPRHAKDGAQHSETAASLSDYIDPERYAVPAQDHESLRDHEV